MRVAVLDDWPNVAEKLVDWSPLQARADVTFFHDSLGGQDEVARALEPFEIIMPMRERTAFPESLVKRLPNLKLFAMTGRRGSSIDFNAIVRHGVTISCSSDGGGAGSYGTAELALGLMLAATRAIPAGDAAIRAGGFQGGVPLGRELKGLTLGVVGLGKLGGRLAHYGLALEMNVIAWSENLTAEKAAAAGVRLVSKDELMSSSDVISLHLVLSDRSRGIVGAADFARMKPDALVMNTSRGPLIDEPSFIAALKTGRISAALDVYNSEPLPPNHPFRSMPNVVLTPHVGYSTTRNIRHFYKEGIENVLAFLDGAPIRLWSPG